jgi:hypothetical protein
LVSFVSLILTNIYIIKEVIIRRNKSIKYGIIL